LSPIALFVYKRPAHTAQVLEALAGNELAAGSDLYIFSDAARNERDRAAVNEVRRIVRAVRGFSSVTVLERERNMGLANSVIAGVSLVCNERGRVIVLEDDLVTSPYFLRFMNDALEAYDQDEPVGSVHGYWYPVSRALPTTFFLRGASCWGWGTWRRSWRLFEADGHKLLAALRARDLTREFDLEGAIDYTRMLRLQIAAKNDSWAIRWHAAMFLAGKLQLSPSVSLVRNIGFDGTGSHSGESGAYEVELGSRPIAVERIPIAECADARAALIHYYRGTRRRLGVRLLHRARRLLALERA
jgi:hypothetical protein